MRLWPSFGNGVSITSVDFLAGRSLRFSAPERSSAFTPAYPDRVDRAILIEQGYLNAKGKAAWETRSAQYISGAGYGLQALLNGFDAAHVAGSDDQASDDFLIGQMGGSVKLSWSNQLRQADQLLGMA